MEAPLVALAGGFGGKGKLGDTTISLYYQNNERYLYLGIPEKDSNIKQLIDDNIMQEKQRLLYVALTRASYNLIVPVWVGKQNNRATLHESMAGILNGFLAPICQEQCDGNNSEYIDFISCFSNQDVSTAPLPREPEDKVKSTSVDENEVDIISPAEALTELAAVHDALHGPCISSYSRIKRLTGHDYTTADEAGENLQLESLDTHDLPGGPSFGSMIHKIFEVLDYKTVQQTTLDEWQEKAEIKDLLLKNCQAFDFSSDYIPQIAALIYHTLSMELKFPNISQAPICQATWWQTEMEFYFPAPDNCSWKITDFAPHWTIERGYIKGFMDLLFSYDKEKFYIVDWKSDILADYTAATLKKHVQNNYDIQASLYNQALAKLLRIKNAADYQKRFGGLLYIFVRATKNGEGCYYYRPKWLALEKEYQKLVTWQLGERHE